MLHARTFLANYSVLVAGDLAARMLNFLALARMARVLGTDLFGDRTCGEFSGHAEWNPELRNAGFLFDPRRPDELADALRSILDNSDRRNDLAERARQRGQEFSWKKATEEVKGLFQEALSS